MILLSMSSSGNSFLQLLNVLLIFVVVLGLTYFTTRWIAGFQKTQMHNKNLQIIETLKITQNKYIQIVRAGEVYLVIAISKDQVTLLAELKDDELDKLDMESLENKDFTKESFSEILEKVKKHIPKK